ncbi:MAG: 30S ribosomal protein S8 [Patescibacteria group bacterium]
MVNDPVSDLIIQIKNASAANKPVISLPYSEMKFTIAEILAKEGFVKSVSKKGKKIKKYLDIELLYNGNSPKVRGVKRISKPGRRVYKKVGEIKKVKQGYGVLVLSTPRGILTDKQAKEEKVGGEALFEIW